MARLSNDVNVLLAAWFALADASPPSKGERLPVTYAGALAALSKCTGKYPRSPFFRYHTRTGLTSGRQRKPRVRRRLYELAT
jgi:hypothetical protein